MVVLGVASVATAGCARTSQAHLAGTASRSGDLKRAVPGDVPELERRLRDAIDAADRLKAAYVGNELADRFLAEGKLDAAGRANRDATEALTEALRAGQTKSPYVDIPLAVEGTFYAQRAADPDYVVRYRNVSRESLGLTLARRAALLASLVSGGAPQDPGLGPEEARRVVQQLERELRKDMPLAQAVPLLFRHAYARFLAEPEGVETGFLEKALRLAAIDRTDLESVESQRELGRHLTPLQQAKLFKLAARACERGSRVSDAIGYYRVAAKALEHTRSSLLSEGDRIAFFQNLDEIYERLVDLCAGADPQMAFEIMERAKARTLLEMLGTDPKLFASTPADRSLVADYFSAIRARQSSTAGGAEADRRLEQARESLSRRLPEVLQLVEIKPVSASGLKNVLQPGETLLSYFVTTRSTVIAVGTSSGVTVVRVPKGRADLQSDAKSLLAAIAGTDPAARRALLLDTGPAAPQSVAESADTAAARLSKTLLDPVREALRNGRALTISPHSVLHSIPFAMLNDPSGVPLAERWELSFVSSASVLDACRKRDKVRSTRGMKVLALGDPKFPVAAEPLPGTRREVQSIGALYRGAATTWLGDEASESRLKAGWSSYDVIHVATHGVFLPADPMRSHLLLAAGGGNDGLLEVAELFNLRTSRAPVVIFSACKTQLGAMSAGDDIIGFNRALYFGGVPTTVTSLWSVSDDATERFMSKLHASLAAGSTPREAMKEAYAESRARMPEPFHWAAFQLNGSGGVR